MTWRREYPVLVAEAQAMGPIGVIRSLGRAGYPVHACSSDAGALGLRSNYACARAVCPDYRHSDFLPWLRQYVQRNSIRAVVPSEGLLLAVRSVFSEFAPLFPCSPREQIVYAGLSKFEVHQLLGVGSNRDGAVPHLPPTLPVEDSAHLPDRSELERLGAPIYIKVDGCHARGGVSSAVLRAGSAEETCQQLGKLTAQFTKLLVQGHVPGQGAGVFFLLWQGQLLAEFMHL